MVKKLQHKKVPERLAKLQKRIEEQNTKKEAEKKALQEKLVENQRLAAINAEKYLEEYLRQDRAEVQQRLHAKQEGNFYVPAEPKVLLVIRIKGINGIPPRERKILKLFRLTRIYNSVFLKANKATINMLRKIEPWVTFGYPRRTTIAKLVYRKGFAKVNRQRLPITDNAQILENLGKHGIKSVEDLVHEIVTSGPRFKEANNFLWPFKLHAPRGGYKHKTKSFMEGGAVGNRENRINELVSKML